MWGLDALLDSFPDACILWCHRTPMKAIASMCSMIETLMKTRTDLEPIKLGSVVMDFYATSLERGLATRDELEPARFIDIAHDDFVRDGLGTIERLYAHFGRVLTPQTRRAMAERLRSNPRHGHGAHEYTLERYGLTAGDVRERFAAYVDRFGLAWE